MKRARESSSESQTRELWAGREGFADGTYEQAAKAKIEPLGIQQWSDLLPLPQDLNAIVLTYWKPCICSCYPWNYPAIHFLACPETPEDSFTCTYCHAQAKSHMTTCIFKH